MTNKDIDALELQEGQFIKVIWQDCEGKTGWTTAEEYIEYIDKMKPIISVYIKPINQ